jgi:exo-beta-1,3-glucanase (GH17 family)
MWNRFHEPQPPRHVAGQPEISRQYGDAMTPKSTFRTIYLTWICAALGGAGSLASCRGSGQGNVESPGADADAGADTGSGGDCPASTAEAGDPQDASPRSPCSTASGHRCLPADVLLRKGVAYSGYRTGQTPVSALYPTEAEIQSDLELLIRGGWSFIRLFDSSTHAERVLHVIRTANLDMRVQLGVWIAGALAVHDQENMKQIASGIALANTYQDIVVSVSVGNETLEDWSSVRTPPADLVGYIGQVRSQVTQPVTTDDMYLPFKLQGQYTNLLPVAEAVDYLSIHVYAFIDAPWSWNWKQPAVPEGPERAQAMMQAGLTFTKSSIADVRAAMTAKGLDRPILIGEAGWKSRQTKLTDPDEPFRAHPVNQQIFYDGLTAWVYGGGRDKDSPESAFYFEAFDEPW